MNQNPDLLTAIIIDDEKHCIDYLTRTVHEYCPQITIVQSFNSIFDGIKFVQNNEVDLVFLDVEMPKGTGFDMLSILEERHFEVVFTTAHNKYIINAIRESASDYLLKPVDPEELTAAVKRVSKKRKENKAPKINSSFAKVSLPTQNGIIFSDPDSIVRCEADGAYTKVYIANDKMLLISKNIRALELVLSNYSFFRVHKSHVINLKHLKQYIKGSGGIAVMSDGSQVSISKRKREDFLEALI